MEINVAVSVGITDVSVERIGGKFKSGLDTPKLHALRRNIAVAMKKRVKKYFVLVRMIASVLE
jgi:hypothetical protein